MGLHFGEVVTFESVLLLVMAVITEPISQRMAPRSVALEIARVARTPLEAAVMVQTAWDEGRLIPGAVNPVDGSMCAFQLQLVPRSVLIDLRECTERAYTKLIASMRKCTKAPLAAYLSGNCETAIEIARLRWARALALLQ